MIPYHSICTTLFYFSFIYLFFIREREREQGRGAEGERENIKQSPCSAPEPVTGLDPTTLEPFPEPKSRWGAPLAEPPRCLIV